MGVRRLYVRMYVCMCEHVFKMVYICVCIHQNVGTGVSSE